MTWVRAIDLRADRVVGRRPTFDASRIVDQIVFAAEHLTTETYLINFDELNPADILEWLARLSSARQAFDGFVQQ